MLALTFTFSCSGGNDDSGDNSGGGTSSPSSSPSGGGNSSPSGEYKGGSCDANYYGAVVIGSQTWMAKNYGCYAPGSMCYNDDPDNCAIYGRLYDKETAKTVCPNGWHLPTDAEWVVLMRNVSPSCSGSTSSCLDAGKKLKADSPLWNENGNGTDDFGFTALPSGSNNGNIGKYADWWSASEDGEYSNYWGVRYSGDEFRQDRGRTVLLSVRCVKN